jgi:hypothetical protein
MAKKRWIINDLNIMMDLDYLNRSLKHNREVQIL